MEERGDLRARTKEFALRIIRLYNAVPESPVGQVIGRQFLWSGTSVGAHYRARSNAEYVSKMQVGVQELEDPCYWLELLTEAKLIEAERLTDLLRELGELIAIFITCVNKARS